MSLGKRVEDERKRRDWTQTQLASKVKGLTQQALDRLEKRDSKTSEHAVAIAEAMQISLRWLLTGNGQRDDADWPFGRVDRARWDACDDGDRGYIQAAFNRALDDCEGNRLRATVTLVPQMPEAHAGASSSAADTTGAAAAPKPVLGVVSSNLDTGPLTGNSSQDAAVESSRAVRKTNEHHKN